MERPRRRAVLRAMGATAVSSLATTGRGRAATRRLPAVLSRAGVERSVAVPKRWYGAYLHAERVAVSLAERYIGTGSAASSLLPDGGAAAVHGVGVTDDPERRHRGRSMPRIRVRVEEGFSAAIPAEVEGLPVETVVGPSPERMVGREPSSDCADPCNRRNFDPVPGGVFGDTGTTCWVVDWRGTDYLLVSSHTLQSRDDPCGFVERDEFYQWTQRVGPVLATDARYDWSVVGLDAASEVGGFEPSVPGRPQRFGGHFTKLGVFDLLSTHEEVYALGSATCETAGVVDWIGVHGGPCGARGNTVGSDIVSDYGDSGGPVFGVSDDGSELFFINIGTEGIVCAPGIGGTAGYHLHSQPGFDFDTG